MRAEENTLPDESDRLMRSTELEIQVKNGTAILSGKACSLEEIVQAENAVTSMSGVDRVFNLVKKV